MALKQYYNDDQDAARIMAHKLCDCFMSGELTLAQLELEIAAEARELVDCTPMTQG